MAGGTVTLSSGAKELLGRSDIGEVFLGRNVGGGVDPRSAAD
jgi:hypothetical protein